jgi:hypothetical protein
MRAPNATGADRANDRPGQVHITAHNFNRDDAERNSLKPCDCSLHGSANRGYLVTGNASEPSIRSVGDLLRRIGGRQ